MSTNNIEFDTQAALNTLRSSQPLTGKDGFSTPFIKQLTETALAMMTIVVPLSDKIITQPQRKVAPY